MLSATDPVAPEGSQPFLNDTLVGGQFTVGERIGAGAFGEVFKATNRLTGVEVAMKFAGETPRKRSALKKEVHAYKTLQHGVPPMGFATMHWHGAEGNFNILVMDLLGPSLKEKYGGSKLPLHILASVGGQMITRIEYLHANYLLHRDVKPDNFCMGLGSNEDIVHLVDFGEVKKYWSESANQHIPCREGERMVGTAAYASVNIHAGREGSRRDDLTAIGYVLVSFLLERLPWCGLGKGECGNEANCYRPIGDMKETLGVQGLCKGLPDQLKTYLKYCEDLQFEGTPDYTYLKKLMTDMPDASSRHIDPAFIQNAQALGPPMKGEAASGSVCHNHTQLQDWHEQGKVKALAEDRSRVTCQAEVKAPFTVKKSLPKHNVSLVGLLPLCCSSDMRKDGPGSPCELSPCQRQAEAPRRRPNLAGSTSRQDGQLFWCTGVCTGALFRSQG